MPGGVRPREAVERLVIVRSRAQIRDQFAVAALDRAMLRLMGGGAVVEVIGTN